MRICSPLGAPPTAATLYEIVGWIKKTINCSVAYPIILLYEEILKEDVELQSKVHKRFENNMKQREKLRNKNNDKSNSNAILRDPLFSLLEYSNGNE